LPTQDWSRVVRTKRSKASVDADAIPVAVIVSYYGGEVREGKSASVKCCIHDDSRRSAVMNTYDNLYFCHTCGKGGSSVAIVMEKENLEFKDAVKRAVEIVTGSGHTLQSKHRRGNARVSRRTWNI
jgi:DNA primase